MAEVYNDTTPGYVTAVRQRRRALLQRLGMGAATAMIFSPVFGWQISVGWVTGYFLIQMIDLWVFTPINDHGVEHMGRFRTMAGNVVLFANAAAFGSLSIPLWLLGGAMGGTCAAVVLASGAIYAIVNSPRSAKVFAITVAPQLIYLAATPFFMSMFGADPAFVTAACISIVVFAAFAISTWQRIDRVHIAENEARILAIRRRDEAERAMTSRTAFLATVGHDLRTPISAILTGAAEMERVATDATSRAHAALITDAGMMMKALLDDLLDHSKLDAGRMTVEDADFNLRALLAQTLRLWQGPIRAKGLALRVEGARDVPAMVRGDAMRLRQVLNNLVSNAMKFTATGSITLRLQAWVEEPTGHALLIEIADTGPGMTREQMARLFTPFDQTAEGVSATHGGTGLGLSISRDLTQLMGGRVTARSQPGQGACFTVSLVLANAINETPVVVPVDESRGDIARALAASKSAVARSDAAVQGPAPVAASAPAPAADADPLLSPAPVVEPLLSTFEVPTVPTEMAEDEPTEAAEDEGRPLSVLVVDDHDINRRAVELILTPLGCDIATAADGMIALRLCETTAFDVIFMDVRMPELDGRETTRRLRAGGGINAAVPVIAVTADTAPEDIAACMDAGMTYFVSKPLTPPALLGALSHVLSGEDAAETDETAVAA